MRIILIISSIYKKKKGKTFLKKLLKPQLSAFWILFICCTNIAQAQDLGAPLIQNFTPKEFNGSSPQVWAVEQDNRGIMYFCVTGEVIEYDGENWRKILISNGSTGRSLAKTKEGKIYIGANGDFGVLEPDSINNLQFQSLKNRIPKINRKFNSIWKIVATEKGVYFMANNKLFRYEPKQDTILTWNSIGKKFDDILQMPNYGLITKSGKEFYVMKNDSLHILPHSKSLSNKAFYSLIPYSSDKILCIADQAIYVYNLKNKEQKDPGYLFETEINEQIKQTRSYTGTKLSNGNLVIATRTKGIFIITPQGKLVKQIGKKSGLLHNCAWSVFESNENLLWLGLDKGISMINLKNPVRKWDHATGFDPYVIRIKEHQKQLYIAAMNGLYKLPLTPTHSATPEKLTKDVESYWRFCEAKFPNREDTLLLVTALRGLHSVNKKEVKTINKTYRSLPIIQSKLRPNIVFQGDENKVYAIEHKNGKWINRDTITNIGFVKYLVENPKGKLYIGLSNKGISQIDIYKNGKKIFNKKTEVLLNQEKGFPTLASLSPFAVKDDIVFVGKGIFTYDNEKDTIIPYEKFGSDYSKRKTYYISDRIDSSLYISNEDGIKRVPLDSSSNFDDLNTLMRIIKHNAVHALSVDKNKNLWAVGADGIFLFNFNKKLSKQKEYHTLVRKITIAKDSIIYLGAELPFQEQKDDKAHSRFYKLPLILDYKNNSIRFDFAAVQFEKPEYVEYKYQLVGFDEDWSNWTEETQYNYTNLYEGDYTFRVKAKNIYSLESTIAEFQFTVKTPWYRSWWAFTLYAVITALVIVTITKLNTRRLKQQNRRLERMVDYRTKEIKKKNIELENKNIDIKNKNVELENQKEEIQAQAEALEIQNQELEKLSVATSETDNAISIMNKDGEFIWVNAAFKRIYGYSFNEFVSKFKSIYNFSQEKDLENKISFCIRDKQSVMYESVIQTKHGEMTWLQTTLTPIFDKNGVVRSFIAVDSDISKLKEYEAELVQSKDEVEAQKDELEKQRDRLKTQHELISASIRYARTIQKAILPSQNEMEKQLEHFILYKPKDIVSGDFYWINSTEDYLYAVVVDCTGHGVPGAFMSMIGNRLLSEIINQRSIYSPKQILDELDAGIRKALRQEKTENKDGMDLIICRLEKRASDNSILLTYAGAKRPLIYFKSQTKTISRVKASGRSIGGSRDYIHKVKFEEHKFQLTKGDVLYLTTDGFSDQNNVDRRKFGTARLVQVIETIAHLPLQEQNSRLEKILSEWQYETEQRDDITIMGIKI